MILRYVEWLRPGRQVGRVAGGMALLFLAVVLVQMLRGWPGWTRDLEVRTSQIRPEPRAKGVFKAPIPGKFRNLITDRQGELMENGRAVGRRSASVNGVLKETGGIYSVHHAFVRWREADGTDPRVNGRVYSVRIPAPVPRWTLWAGLGVLTWAWSGRWGREPVRAAAPAGDGETAGAGFWQGRRRVWREAAVLAVLVAGVSVLAWSRCARVDELNDGVMMIKGLPYSDAACWYEMSVSLAEGRGLASAFDGQRPWYSVMMAMIHAARGVMAVENGLMLNSLCLGLGSGFLYLLGALCGWRLAGLGAAVVLVFSRGHQAGAAALLTETPGMGLTVLSVVLLVGAGRLPVSPGMRAMAAAAVGLGGFFQALGNLTCPYTLAAAPFYGVLLLTEGRRWAGHWRTWRILRPGLIYSLGFLLVLGPWLVRQKQVHGLLTLSTQTADLLYGATFEEGPMKPRQQAELRAHQAVVGYSAEEKYRFGMRRFGETVKADPVLYVKRLGAGALAFFDYFNVSGPLPASVAVVVVVAGMWRRREERGRLAWVVSGIFSGALAVWLIFLPALRDGPWPLLGLAAGSAAAAWLLGPAWGRNGVLWVASTLAGCALINALTGNLIAGRCWIFCDWALWLLVFGAVTAVQDRLGEGLVWMARRKWVDGGVLVPEVCGGGGDADEAGVRAGGGAKAAGGFGGGEKGEWVAGSGEAVSVVRVALVAACILVAVQGVSGVALLSRQGKAADFACHPAAGEEARVRRWAEGQFAGQRAASGSGLELVWARLGEGACFLAANEEATLFSRAFLRKTWPRTLRLLRGVPERAGDPAPGFMARLPGDARALPEDRPGWVVAWVSVDRKANLGHDEEIYEVLAFLPGDAAGNVDETRAIFLTDPQPAAESGVTAEGGRIGAGVADGAGRASETGTAAEGGSGPAAGSENHRD